MHRVAVIDFAASCLPEAGSSYPIEVALAQVGGALRHWVIRPHLSWRYWDWTEEAERHHGWTRDRLEREGQPVGEVLEELVDAARGHVVHADCELDAYWLETLAIAAGQAPPFAVHDLGEAFAALGVCRDEVDRAQQAARAAVSQAAGPDRLRARHWAETIGMLMGSRSPRWLSVA